MKQKIKIPDGYEMISNEGDLYIPKRQGDAILSTTQPSLIIPLKKKEPKQKSFSKYVKEYLNSLDENIFNVKDKEKTVPSRDGVASWTEESKIKKQLLTICVNDVPFELRIGLLKFICDDINFDWRYAIWRLTAGSEEEKKPITKICPKEFLETLNNMYVL